MSTVLQEVFESAKALSLEEQMQLVEALLGEQGDESVETCLEEEVARRSHEFDAGGIEPVKWSDVKARLLNNG